ncbi:alpha-galactosidase [Micromonospora sp. NPDC048909]|uniref:alpha-galactosidase n=1 Tax=Micromonospora sp. NPDC048909 TaxID=3155643 RepID=UPI0033F0842B
MTPTAEIVALHGRNASVLVELSRPIPRILHWGLNLGELGVDELTALHRSSIPSSTHNSTDDPRYFTVLATEADAWSGTPAVEGHLRDGSPFPRFVLSDHFFDPTKMSLQLTLADQASGLTAALTYRLDEHDVLAVDMSISADASAATPYHLTALTALLPLPEGAVECVDFTGKWARERSPQRSPILPGTRLRESRRGRPSLDSPYLLMAGTASFGFGHGEVWAVHLGWSGSQRYLVEQLPEGAGVHRSVLGAGELLLPGEVVLNPGETYRSPTVYFAWSNAGMDGIAEAFHAMLRSRPRRMTPRPLTLNTWEAVYFNHDIDTLHQLVERAARVGVERIVLDDGWFTGRRNDTAGLGDWYVDKDVWPDGLWPLVDAVRDKGMQFGLWFEPEMVNLRSRIAADHPEWLLAPAEGEGPAIRHQHVLNLADEDAWHYVLERIDSIVTEYQLDYIKWDHNRELHEAALRRAYGRAGVRAQTLALYRMIDTLRDRHPGLEIESCASGGGRIDLGILQRTDRVWASDCNDPVERQDIQRWTAQLIPLEFIGTHLGASESHTTGRVTALSFRLATALFGHAGIEADLTACSADELSTIAAWAKLYKELRGLLHSGRLVRADLADAATLLDGVVAHDGTEALYSWVRLATSNPVQAGRIRLPGLEPARWYRVRVRTEVGESSLHEGAPIWLDSACRDGFVVSGVIATEIGLPMPTLNPQQAMLLHVVSD